MSRTLQETNMWAVKGMRLAKNTIETLKHIRDTKSFDAFFESILAKKYQILELGEPILKKAATSPHQVCNWKCPSRSSMNSTGLPNLF